MSESSPLSSALLSARSRVSTWAELAGLLGFSVATLRRALHPGQRPLRRSTASDLAFNLDLFLSGQPTPDPPPPRPVEGDRFGRFHKIGIDPAGINERDGCQVINAASARDGWEEQHLLAGSALRSAARALDGAEQLAVSEPSPAATMACVAAGKHLVSTLHAFGLIPVPRAATIDPLEEFRALAADPAQDHRPPA